MKETGYEFYGAFDKEFGKMQGFLIIHRRDDNVINLTQQKTVPASEKQNVNFALIDFVLNKFNTELAAKQLIFSNGQRNIRHDTQFNEWLCKYFGFRRAYAHLHIVFPPIIDTILKTIAVMIPSKLLNKHTSNRLLYQIQSVFKYIKIAQY